MDKTMADHCNPLGTLCHLEEPALENTDGTCLCGSNNSSFPKVSLVILSQPKTTVPISLLLKDPWRWGRKRKSIPLLLIISFSPQKLTREAASPERFLVLFQIVLEQKKNPHCINIRVWVDRKLLHNFCVNVFLTNLLVKKRWNCKLNK